MVYTFSEKEEQILKKIKIPFNPLEDLTEEQEEQLLDILSDYYGSVAYEADGELIGDILTHMAQQARKT